MAYKPNTFIKLEYYNIVIVNYNDKLTNDKNGMFVVVTFIIERNLLTLNTVIVINIVMCFEFNQIWNVIPIYFVNIP